MPPEPPPSADPTSRLIAAGEYHEAARLLTEYGEYERAQALLEKVWDFAGAAALAHARGDRVGTLRLLLDGKDVAGAGIIRAEIVQSADDAELRAAAEVCERRRMWREAAELRLQANEPAAARELFARAGQLLDAGRLDERMGRLREAGLAYEQLLGGAPEAGEEARARVALGRVLGLLGRHEEAVRKLQLALGSPAMRAAADAATGDEEVRDEAARLLVISLAGLGLRDGAAHVLARERARHPALEELDAFLARASRERGGGDLLAGRYRVLRLIGAGAMGRVYLAEDRVTEEEVAVKVVPPPIEPRAREGYRRFLREARAVATLSHANVVAAREVIEAQGLLVMEFLPGGTLETRAEAGRPGLGMGPTAAARKILVEVTSGLAAAHARGIVHRDVKPANIFFAATGEAKLGDFGAAHLQDLGATRTAGFVGTLAYMAPEQITSAPITFACDVYALGVTTFQLLTGRLPFEGPDFVGQHLGETPPALSSRVAAPGPEWTAWDRLVARMLAKDPAARQGSLDELRREIDALPVRDDPAGASFEPTASSTTEPVAPRGARYRIEAEAGATAISTLHHGVDERLGRPVTIERLQPGALEGAQGAARVARLHALARFGGPHLQRVLRFDARDQLVAYEMVSGARAIDLPRPQPAAAVARLALDVLRALAGPHETGAAHGALARAILLEPSGATVTIAGTLAVDAASPRADLAELRALLLDLAPALPLPSVESGAAALVAWARATLEGSTAQRFAASSTTR